MLFLSSNAWGSFFSPAKQNTTPAEVSDRYVVLIKSDQPACSYLNESYSNLTRNSFQKALTFSDKATSSTNEYELQEAYIIKGLAYFKLEQIENAFAAIDKAMEYNSRLGTYSLRLEFAKISYYKHKGDFAKAINYLKILALEIPPEVLRTRGYFLNWIGWMYYENQQIEAAKQVFQHAITNSNKDPHLILEAYHGLLIASFARNQLSEATALIDQARYYLPFGTNDEKYNIYSAEILVFEVSGQLDRALNLAKSLITDRKTDFQLKIRFQKNLNELIIRKANLDKISTAKKINEKNSAELEAIKKQLVNHIDGHRYTSAEILYTKALRLAKKYNFSNENIIFTGIRLSKAQRKYSHTMRQYEALLKLLPKKSPEYKENYFDYKLLYLHRKLDEGINIHNIFEVLQEIQNTSYVDSSFLLTDYSVKILEISFDLLKIKSADDFKIRYPHLDNFFYNDIYSHFFWGHFWMSRKNLEGARNEFNVLIKYFKDSPVGYAGLQNVFLQEKRVLDSLGQYVLARKLLGSRWFGYIQNPLATSFDQVQKSLEVRDFQILGDELLQQLPIYRNVIYSLLGKLYADKGLLAEAEKMCQLSISSASTSGSKHPDWPYFILGEVSEKRGDLVMAQVHYEKALSLAPKIIWSLAKVAEFYQRINRVELAIETHLKIIAYAKNAKDDFEEINTIYINNELSKTNLQLGKINLGLGFKKSALTYFKKVMEYGVVEHKKIAGQHIASLLALTN